MVEQTIYEVLDTLAERYIPEGKHKMLHVNSRKAWVDLMTELLESGTIKKKLSILTKCATSWELLLTQKFNILN
jgi:hypothetical protein